MFKKSLLALAVLGFAGTAAAVEVTVPTAETVSVEGVAAGAEGIVANDVMITLGAEYAVGDILTLNIAGSAFDLDADYVLEPSGTPSNEITWGFLSATESTVTFRVTQLDTSDGTATTVGDMYVLGDGVDTALAVDVDGIAVGDKVTFTASAQTSTGFPIDVTSGEGAHALTGISEMPSVMVTAGEATVDVSSGRTVFEGGATTTDFTFMLKAAAATADQASITLGNSHVTVNGNFAGVSSLTVGADAATIAEDDMSALLEDAALVADADNTVTFTTPAEADSEEQLVAPQTFTLDVVTEYTTVAGAEPATFDLASDVDAAEWDLNGAVVNIPYMPYGTNISQIIYVTSTSATPAPIAVTAWDEEGEMYDLGEIATTGLGVTKITNEVREALAAAGFSYGKVSIDVSVNAPDESITVYAAYSVAGNRATINTSQYKGK